MTIKIAGNDDSYISTFVLNKLGYTKSSVVDA